MKWRLEPNWILAFIHRRSAEETELIDPPVKLRPDEGYIRFRHTTAAGPGPYRRVKITADGLDEAMRRCAKEFG